MWKNIGCDKITDIDIHWLSASAESLQLYQKLNLQTCMVHYLNKGSNALLNQKKPIYSFHSYVDRGISAIFNQPICLLFQLASVVDM